MTLRIHYYNREQNFGDTANYDLCKKLSGKEPVWVDEAPGYLVMGSIIDHPRFPAEVWGSGLLSPDLVLQCRPKKVHAVRGPRTRDWLMKLGVPCPEVYGDPGILFPLVYKPTPVPTYDLGIVPHYADYGLKLFRGLPPNVLLIDVRQDPAKVVKDITSCLNIASSSLHGLIAADAYCIPSVWTTFGDRVWGGGFKFLDYFETVRGAARISVDLRREVKLPVAALIQDCRRPQVNHLVKPLLEACPFLDPDFRQTS